MEDARDVPLSHSGDGTGARAARPEGAGDRDEHPRGTLALVGLYGVLFALGWLAIYVYIYLARGPVTK